MNIKWSTLHRFTVVSAVIVALAAGAGVVIALADDDEPANGPVTAAEREPLRKAPLITRADEGPQDAPVEAEEDRPTQLPSPDPREFAAGTPQRALAGFLAAWRNRRFSVMQTWTGGSATRSDLRRRYGPQRLRGWLLREGTEVAPDTAEFLVTTATRTLLRDELRRRDMTFRVERRDGAWGVDPVPGAAR